ncbi:MAG: SCO6745 family protein [Actinomycetes bacterium]
MTDWPSLSARASFASHRLIGWIYWDPAAVARYAVLGVEGGVGYYVASRGAPLAAAGHQAVAAAFYSIHPGFVQVALDLAAVVTTWEAVTDARNAAVGEGLRELVPEICDDLSALGPDLWAAADALPVSGRVLFAAHRQWPRPDDPLVSAWLAVNCIREWRGDTHWAVLAAEGLGGTQAGLLHNAFLDYPANWIPRSRGADDEALAAAMEDLEARGLATDGTVNADGLALRQRIEDRTDLLCEQAWRTLGASRTLEFLQLVEPVGDRLLARIDETAGPEWMPAARRRRD